MAYSMFRPDLGYVQGMSYVAGSLLLHFGTEYETFMLFSNLMGREDMLFDFYSFDMDKVGVVFQVFMKLLKEKVPNLHVSFEKTNLSCSIFLFEWVVAIYSNIFPLETSSRVWDNFMYYGEFYIIKVALALCLCIEAKVTSGDSSFENLVLLLKNVKQEVTSDQMFKAVQDLKLTKVQFIKVKKQILNSIVEKPN
uniref:Rab-GAP TBC domain-containing protein n=1 Tax=Strombidium inclinatum TaxID=197538 RepID=A0A7S3IK57_9SPIT|mmetsp:Transcript_24209/g.37279  ORF Transcript_24209/g.37279 Transcript_24209/m.37279 type:complete len:195 (+) Transcript_24209:1271-1855(+)